MRPGHKVLVNGAGGSAGSFAVQLAKLDGAEVTAVDKAGKLAFLRSLGADRVLDCAREDFTRSGERYDLILDLIARGPATAYARALRPKGTYFFVGGSVAVLVPILLVGPWISKKSGKDLRLLVVRQSREDLIAITRLCEAGQIRPVIDRRYPLGDVPEALRYIGEGRHEGKVVITMDADAST